MQLPSQRILRPRPVQPMIARWCSSVRCRRFANMSVLRDCAYVMQSRGRMPCMNVGSGMRYLVSAAGNRRNILHRTMSRPHSAVLSTPDIPTCVAYRATASSADKSSASLDTKTSQDNGEFRALLSMRRFVWPKDDLEGRRRVLIAASLMVTSKCLGLAVPLALRSIIDGLAPATSSTLVVLPIVGLLAYGGLRLAQSACSELRNVVFSTFVAKALSGLSNDVFNHLLQLPLDYHLRRQTGAVATVVNRGVRGLQWLLSVVVFNVLPTIFEIGIVSGLLWFSLGTEFALVNLCTVGAYIAWTFSVTSWRTEIRRRMNTAETKSGSLVVDSLLNYETVKYFGAESLQMQKYGVQLSQYEDGLRKTAASLGLLNFGQQMIFTAGMTTMMFICSQGVVAGSMSVGDLVMANTLLLQLSQPLNWLGTMYSESRRSLVDFRDLLAILEEPLEQPALNVGASPLILPDASAPSLEFRGVSFKYPGSIEPLLRDISFHVPAGTSIAFVGTSGSGKSTLFRLLFRFFDQMDGAIILEGTDLRNLTVESVRQQIGIIPQDIVLFNTTLCENIAYGNPSASREDVEAAISAAALDGLVATLPEGLETRVGERGLKLSGGEKQRVAIARTILRRPSLLLVDEGTSSLDTQTERHVMEQLQNLSSNRQVTTLVIAHRLSTVQDADQIAVIDKGSIVELGSHSELISREGLYHALWMKQQEDE